MNINSDGAEIDAATDMEVYGDWIKFVDGEGATVKIDPSVIRKLYEFATVHAEEFDEGAWNIDWQPVFATHQISEEVKTLASISNLPRYRFAALVAAHEREACAKLCEAQGEYGDEQYAKAIRARGTI